MNAAAALSIASVLSAGVFALLLRRLAVAPGSREQRWFAVVVSGSSAYALFDLATDLPASPRIVFGVAGLALASVTVVTWGWIRFSQEFASASPGRVERAVSTALLAALPVLVLPVPGLFFSGRIIDRPYAPLGVVYRQAATTPLGDAVMAALLAISAAVLVRLVRAWRRGVPHAGPLAVAYATMWAFSLSDALAVAFVLPLPFLLDSGWVAPVVAVGWAAACRHVEATRSLEKLRGELAAEVEARTRTLSSTLETLHQAEKVAALGRFANGVAHEVNNPAAAVTSALEVLAEAGVARPGTEEAEALSDARRAMHRITALVRQILDAGMVALPTRGTAAADVTRAVGNVARAQPARFRGALAIRLAGPAARVRLTPEALELVLGALVRNATEATPPDSPARIEVRAEQTDGHVRISVTDRGAGMAPEVLRHAFDPFFTTKPAGHGAGLGLAVARGLVQAGGGSLTLDSAPGEGTRAVVELPAAAPDAVA